MVDQIDESVSVPKQEAAEIGAVLTSARNAKKLTQTDVSNNLRISVKQVDAIERDDFDALPESAITRGFIRNYARLLGIDAEPLLANHRERFPEQKIASLSVETTTRQVLSRKKHLPLLKLLIGALLLLLGVAYVANYMGLFQSGVNHSSLSATSGEQVYLPEVALPMAERVENQPPVAAVTDVSGVGNSVQFDNHSTISGSTIAQTAALAVSPTTGLSAAPSSVLTNQYKVQMKFSEQTWVSVKNQFGKVVYEKTFAAGDEGGIDVEPPFSLIVGNAKAAQVTYLGQRLDLTAFTKGNVARVKLPL